MAKFAINVQICVWKKNKYIKFVYLGKNGFTQTTRTGCGYDGTNEMGNLNRRY